MKDQIKDAPNVAPCIFRTKDVSITGPSPIGAWIGGDLKVSSHDLKAIETPTAKGLVNGRSDRFARKLREVMEFCNLKK